MKRQPNLKPLNHYEETPSNTSEYEIRLSIKAISELSRRNSFQMSSKSFIHKTNRLEKSFKLKSIRESKIDFVSTLRLFRIFYLNIHKRMPIEWVSEFECQPLFKIFLRRIWFKNYDEYIELFGDDIEKRKETVRRFRKTYPRFSLNQKK